MSYDKNTKLITLEEAIIDGEVFKMTTKEKEDFGSENYNIDVVKNIDVKNNYNLKRLRQKYKKSMIW